MPPKVDTFARIPTFVLFGDSITQFSMRQQGWGQQLAEVYERKADVITRGFSGYNTRMAINIFPRVLSHLNVAPSLITIAFGANDAAARETTVLQYVPEEEYEQNLRTLVEQAKMAAPDAAIVLLSPPPVCNEQWPARGNDVAVRYAARCSAVASATGSCFVDMFSLMHAETDWLSFLCDGLHLNANGNTFYSKALVSAINSSYPALASDTLPLYYPRWDAVLNHDAAHPEAKLTVTALNDDEHA